MAGAALSGTRQSPARGRVADLLHTFNPWHGSTRRQPQRVMARKSTGRRDARPRRVLRYEETREGFRGEILQALKLCFCACSGAHPGSAGCVHHRQRSRHRRARAPCGFVQERHGIRRPLARTTLAVADEVPGVWRYNALADVAVLKLAILGSIDNSVGVALVGPRGGQVPLMRVNASLSDTTSCLSLSNSRAMSSSI